MLSVVIPAYNEEKRLEYNIHKIIEYLEEFDYELILVDDGSKDATWSIIKSLRKENEKIKGLRFSRNFGKESAVCAGIDVAGGDAVIIMDSDLQHPPAMISEMIEKWKEGYKIVECVKENRGKEKLSNKIFAGLFYKTLSKFTGYNMTNASDFKLLDRDVVEALKSLNEGQVFFRGLVEWVGYEKYQLMFTVPEREGDTSKFKFSSLMKLALTAITSFSSSLLYITIFIGAVFFVGAILLGIQTIVNKALGYSLTGFTTVILLQLIIGSSILFSLGIIGIYLAKIYNEVKRRPRYIVSEKQF